jgi:hypothetical protein
MTGYINNNPLNGQYLEYYAGDKLEMYAESLVSIRVPYLCFWSIVVFVDRYYNFNEVTQTLKPEDILEQYQNVATRAEVPV